MCNGPAFAGARYGQETIAATFGLTGGYGAIYILIYLDDIIYTTNPAMRTLVDITDDQISALAELCERLKQPRAALIREAIGEYLARRSRVRQGSAFGLWGTKAPDGLAYQRKARAEW
jgi:predicted transcriptional regulator